MTKCFTVITGCCSICICFIALLVAEAHAVALLQSDSRREAHHTVVCPPLMRMNAIGQVGSLRVSYTLERFYYSFIQLLSFPPLVCSFYCVILPLSASLLPLDLWSVRQCAVNERVGVGAKTVNEWQSAQRRQRFREVQWWVIRALWRHNLCYCSTTLESCVNVNLRYTAVLPLVVTGLDWQLLHLSSLGS